jgi:phosphatidyl-myo-inositol dimannoside synthase
MKGVLRKKKILYLCGDISTIGGIQKYNSDLISSVSNKMFELKIIQREVGGLTKKIKFFLSFLYEIFKFRPNHIFCSHINFSPLLLMPYILSRTSFSIIFYGIDALEIKNFFHKMIIKLSKKIVVISDYTKSIVLKQFPFVESKLFLLKSSVNPDNFVLYPSKSKLKKKFNLEKKEVILTLSRLATHEDKGQHRVLYSLEKVLAVYPNARYIIAGPGEDERVDEFLINNPHISNHVIRLNSVSEQEKNVLYGMCDAFILPSKTEGFGIVFIEALACGAVVIAPNNYGCPEALDNGRLGIVVDPDDISKISEAIISAINRAKNMSLSDRLLLRNKTIKKFGKSKWNKDVSQFLTQASET